MTTSSAFTQTTSSAGEAPRCAGVMPLTGRTEPWMEAVLADPDGAAALVREHGSPLNLHDFSALARNAAELTEAAAAHGVTARVFVARKANKTLGLVEAGVVADLGFDVASFNELDQCLVAGVAPHDLIVSAALKGEPLLRRAISAGVPISLDNLDEAALAAHVAREVGKPARVALRLAIVADGIAPSRFGLTPQAWLAALADPASLLGSEEFQIDGLHFHLNGYGALERSEALRQACRLADALTARGVTVRYVDMGGGVPMRYLEDEAQWRAFWAALAAEQDQQHDQPHEQGLTWRGDRLGLSDAGADRPSSSVYPYWQPEIRGPWLERVLTAPGAGADASVAQSLVRRGLTLHCEPGRAVLDGCGMTLARVVFRKTTSDGVALVGLEMNRTQVRSTSADFLVDPVWLRPGEAGEPDAMESAFLVGAYCIEEELILRRRLALPDGVAVGDIVAFPNTGGYLMHIVESASHQLPLARNLVLGPVSDPEASRGWHLDRIDLDRRPGLARLDR